MSRFIAAHPNPWGWNPTQYCGLPTQFTYLPLLHYLTAALTWIFPSAHPEFTYRIVTAASACVGPVTLFFLVLYFTKDRWWAAATALAYTFASPSYWLIQQIDRDRGVVYLPWRLQVLAKYGEGPHNAGLTLLPLALLAVWIAATQRGFRHIFLAAIALAAVALTNWVAALALAFCCLMLMLAAAGTGKISGFRISRVIASAALAYLLACFWLTPTFVKTIAFNWPADAFNYHLRREQALLLLALLAGLFLFRITLLRFSAEPYFGFVTLSFFGFTWIVLAHYWFGKDAIPESRRYALEFELFFFLFFFELFRRVRRSSSRTLNRCAIALAIVFAAASARQAWAYSLQGWKAWTPVPREKTVEYRVVQWLADRQPAGRIFASGGVRFRMNAWSDLPQVGGTFESGLTNRIPLHFDYQIRTGIGSPPGLEGPDAVLQLKAMGVEYIVVNGPKSKEHYRDFRNPLKFEGLLERVYQEPDDWIYHLPVRSLAHLVRGSEFPGYAPIYGYLKSLRAYVGALEDPVRPKLKAVWKSTTLLAVEGRIPEDMAVSVQVNENGGWKAMQDGREILIDKDKLGFMILYAHPAQFTHIELTYRGTNEQRVMAAFSALAWAGSAAGLLMSISRSRLLK